jgi:hypothetical protein
LINTKSPVTREIEKEMKKVSTTCNKVTLLAIFICSISFGSCSNIIQSYILLCLLGHEIQTWKSPAICQGQTTSMKLNQASKLVQLLHLHSSTTPRAVRSILDPIPGTWYKCLRFTKSHWIVPSSYIWFALENKS